MKNIESNQNENQLSRRAAVLQSIGAIGTLFVAKSALAQIADEVPICPPPPPKLVKVIESEISKNHGHEFFIALSEVIKLTGQALSIQGDSGHPHTITISNDQVIALMKGEHVVIVSSKDAGHTHQVTLALVEKPAEG